MVRPATIEDIPQLVEFGQAFFNESGLNKHMTYCAESTAGTMANLIEGAGVIFVLEVDGLLYGGVAGMVSPHYFNLGHLTGQELFWYVTPELRGLRESLQLIEHLEQWARDKGANTFALAAMATSSPAVRRLYERRGYTETETYYLGRL